MNTTNVDISWNGKAPGTNEGKTTTELDHPFLVSKLDFTILNNLVGSTIRPHVLIAIPQN